MLPIRAESRLVFADFQFVTALQFKIIRPKDVYNLSSSKSMIHIVVVTI